MTLPVMKNFINGEWVESKTTTFGDVWNPAKGEKIATVPYGVKEDVDMAVQAAKAAYPEWRATPPLSRARYLFRLKEAFEENFEEIARVLTTEQGKAIDDSRGEVRRMIENVEHATAVTTLMTGYTLEDIAKALIVMVIVSRWVSSQPLFLSIFRVWSPGGSCPMRLFPVTRLS